MKKPLLLLFSFFTFFIAVAQQPFITTWEVGGTDLSIKIPANTNYYNYNYSIDFGDGNILYNQTNDVIYIYTNPGIYTVSISGNYPHFYAQKTNNIGTNNDKLLSVEQWGDIQWQSMEGSFYECENLVVNATDAPDLSEVTDFSRMFEGATNFNQDINHWDTSTITNMSAMFKNAHNFNQPLNNWDVSDVINMSEMFYFNIDFNQPLNNWDVSSVVEMEDMFYKTYFFNQDLNNWDVSNVINMRGMFKDAIAFNGPLNNWNVTNVITMREMFDGAINFDQPLNNWDVSNVTTMREMFYDANSFNQPIGNWNITSVTDMSRMFMRADSFNQPLNNWDVSNVQQISVMFYAAPSFNQPLDNWDISNVINLSGMFTFASSFNQDLSSWDFNSINTNSFISYTGMDATNYDKLLDRFAQLGILDVTLNAHELKYCDEVTRQQLINRGWTFSDNGLADDCNFNYVSGDVFFDYDNNNCDSDDIQLSNFMLNVNNGTTDISVSVNNSGRYVIGLAQGSYALNIENLNSNFSSVPNVQYFTFAGDNESIDNENFCIQMFQPFKDLSIDIFPLDDAIPGFESEYQVVVSNNGTYAINNIQVDYTYDNIFQTFVSSTLTPNINTTNLLTFQIPSLTPFNQEIFEITLLNATPPTLNSGDILILSGEVGPENNDINLQNNTARVEQTVVNSFDPNDKMVVQGDEIEIDETDQYLDYRIRFQNLGTANALNVKITDTIDNNLDWTTFQPITSSHDYRIEIVDGEQINYYFDNINLPFETADPEGSNGYITYKIKPKSTVQIGDTFENTAYIYFDFNLPIVTNTVVTTVVDELSVDVFDFSRIKIYPNPVSDQLNIELPDNLNLNSIDLFDIKGKRLKSFKNQTDLDLSDMQKGIYILKLETDQGSFHHKVIKQ